MKHFSLFNSSVGQKILMAITGIFLTIFLVVHCYVNANVLFVNAEENFNRAANFMGTNILIRISEVILFIALIVHIYKGFYLYFYNKRKRKIKYKVAPPSFTSTWYSRSMTLLGTLILFFLIVHLENFWIPTRFGMLEPIQYQNGTIHTHNLYKKMALTFSDIKVVLIYIVGCISLSWHLLHGVQSAFRTLGVIHKPSTKIIKIVAITFAIAIPFIFALMPIFMFLGIEIDIKGITFLF